MSKIKKEIYTLQGGRVIDVREYLDARYGSRAERAERTKPTEEQIQKVNARNKANLCRMRMLEYIKLGDLFATWTYNPKNRPPGMKAALKDFQKAMRYVRKEYKKRGYEVFWFRNIERGTKGAWHIHLVINEIGETASILTRAWEKGGTWSVEIQKSKFYDEDFTKLASYMTKDEHTVETKKDGTPGKPRLSEASYNHSRNMPLPKPKIRRLTRWNRYPKPKKDYYIARMYEGVNPYTGSTYRRYTMIRLNRRI